MKKLVALLFGVASFAAGCGGGTSPGGPMMSPIPSMMMPGTPNTPPAMGGDDFAPPPEGQGFQYLMTSTIDAGHEIERCKFYTTPPEGFYIKTESIRYTPGSHHVLLYLTPYEQIPTVSLRNQTIDTRDVFDCADGATADWKVSAVVAGSQSLDGKSVVNDLPDGVGVKIPGNRVLLMNTHYLNAKTMALETTARINVYTMPKEQVTSEAGVLFFYNPMIRIKAESSDSARMRCPIWKDINIVGVQSHMHKRGVGFFADIIDQQGATAQQMYTSKSWENVPVAEFQPVLSLKAGQAIEYQCDYNNTEMRDIHQGFSTRDEMCMLVGVYYPADENLQNCRDTNGNFAGVWTGHGTAGCGESLRCVQNAKPMSVDGGEEFFGCVVDSCPSVGPQLSAALQCFYNQGNGSCTTVCATNGADSDRCNTCVTNACGAQAATCMAATCGTP